MRILHIDWTRCDGHGACTELLPELLDRDDWGFPLPRDGLEVDPRLEELAERAVKACPVLALSLLRTPGRRAQSLSATKTHVK